MGAFEKRIPKAELHLHIEGTLEPEMMFEFAKRNRVPLRFDSPEEIRGAYRFRDLQSFLDIYYEGAKALVEERDFFELTAAYLQRAAAFIELPCVDSAPGGKANIDAVVIGEVLRSFWPRPLREVGR